MIKFPITNTKKRKDIQMLAATQNPPNVPIHVSLCL